MLCNSDIIIRLWDFEVHGVQFESLKMHENHRRVEHFAKQNSWRERANVKTRLQVLCMCTTTVEMFRRFHCTMKKPLPFVLSSAFESRNFGVDKLYIWQTDLSLQKFTQALDRPYLIQIKFIKKLKTSCGLFPPLSSSKIVKVFIQKLLLPFSTPPQKIKTLSNLITPTPSSEHISHCYCYVTSWCCSDSTSCFRNRTRKYFILSLF